MWWLWLCVCKVLCEVECEVGGRWVRGACAHTHKQQHTRTIREAQLPPEAPGLPILTRCYYWWWWLLLLLAAIAVVVVVLRPPPLLLLLLSLSVFLLLLVLAC